MIFRGLNFESDDELGEVSSDSESAVSELELSNTTIVISRSFGMIIFNHPVLNTLIGRYFSEKSVSGLTSKKSVRILN